jgi:hypothetical protein
VGGLNSGILPNFSLALNDGDWGNSVQFNIKYNELQLIKIKFEVEDNPDLGYGTVQILVAEKE